MARLIEVSIEIDAILAVFDECQGDERTLELLRSRKAIHISDVEGAE